MREEEYLAILTEQMRCKKARNVVAEEIRGHIQDQKNAWMDDGMAEEEAEVLAVQEMGDPVETGTALDRIHRPKMAWGMVCMISMLSIAGFLLQYLLQSHFTEEVFLPGNLVHHLLYLICGFVVMMLVCLADYSRIGYWAKEITVLLFLVLTLGVKFWGLQINGVKAWILLPTGSLNVRMAVLLFVPLYGAVLYCYRRKGYWAIMRCVLWMAPAILVALFSSGGITVLILFVTFLVTLSYAVCKNWFCVSKWKVLSCLWGGTILVSASWVLYFSSEYQRQRLEVFLGNAYQLNESLLPVKMIRTGQLVPGSENYVLAYAVAYYGILVGVLLVGMLLLLFIQLLSHSMKQKNQLGMMMGVGCSFVLLIQLILYLLNNLGMIPNAAIYCPFLTYGGSGILVTYVLLGLLLSIYRYQNVIDKNPEVKEKMGLGGRRGIRSLG